jgi:enterobactin synthetase component D / holo-[acyl-carrier protein] synthase
VSAALFPAGVSFVRATPEMEDQPLHPAERAYAESLGAPRRREFALGRTCARRALAGLGIRDFPLLNRADRVPLWPAGVVGSLTHCRGFCAVVVAARGAIVGLGLDAEPSRSLSDRMIERITTPRERDHLAELPDAPSFGWGLALFTAKESLYKCYFPIAGAFLGFRDAEIEIDPSATHFTARVCRDEKPDAFGVRSFQGRLQMTAEHVVSAVTLTASECAGGRAG